MRLIDADVLKDVIRQHDYPLADRLNSVDNGMFTVGIFQAIDQMPTISADEVRGVGKWIKRVKARENLPNDSDWLYSCSVCGRGDVHNENVQVPYCWHCGAKMEVSEDD